MNKIIKNITVVLLCVISVELLGIENLPKKLKAPHWLIVASARSEREWYTAKDIAKMLGADFFHNNTKDTCKNKSACKIRDLFVQARKK
jgi:hypothetical protein